jgi:hypothetical protein
MRTARSRIPANNVLMSHKCFCCRGLASQRKQNAGASERIQGITTAKPKLQNLSTRFTRCLNLANPIHRL